MVGSWQYSRLHGQSIHLHCKGQFNRQLDELYKCLADMACCQARRLHADYKVAIACVAAA